MVRGGEEGSAGLAIFLILARHAPFFLGILIAVTPWATFVSSIPAFTIALDVVVVVLWGFC